MTPTQIILHHSLTKDNVLTVSWGSIRRYHLGLGWDDIGYHAGVEMVRGQPEVLMGRMWDVQGAHARENRGNHNSLGLCIVGNFDDDAPPPEVWGKALQIVRYWMRLFDIPVEKVYGHCDFSYKSCPGQLFDLNQFREEL
jgi:hypothetical protein